MEKQVFHIPTSRIEQFSDGVFSIIITLLVLELKVPEFRDEAGLKENFGLLMKMTPKFVSFLLSFIFIAVYWVNHHQLYQSIKQSDRGLLWHNIHLLFWLILIPFAAAMAGDHPNSPVTVMYMAFVFLMASVASYMLRRHAHYNSHLMHEKLTTDSKEGPIKKTLFSILLYIIIIIMAPIQIYISYGLFAVALAMFIVPPRLQLKNQNSIINKTKENET